MQFEVLLSIIGMALIYLLALFTIPYLLIRRAAAQVVAIFRKHCATDAPGAVAPDALGLEPQGFLSTIVRRRDYKSNAFQMLLKSDVIIETEDKRVYLSEKGLRKLCENKGWKLGRLCDPESK